jgi:hypothetical protein
MRRTPAERLIFPAPHLWIPRRGFAKLATTAEKLINYDGHLSTACGGEAGEDCQHCTGAAPSNLYLTLTTSDQRGFYSTDGECADILGATWQMPWQGTDANGKCWWQCQWGPCNGMTNDVRAYVYTGSGKYYITWAVFGHSGVGVTNWYNEYATIPACSIFDGGLDITTKSYAVHDLCYLEDITGVNLRSSL